MRFDKTAGLFVALAAFALGGCATAAGTSEQQPTEDTAIASSLDSCGLKVEGDKGVIEALENAGRKVYFDFDKSDIKSSESDRARAQSEALAKMAPSRVRIEGNADERGTREYNLALGERRAAALRDKLIGMGVSSDQVEIVSYGEECPAVAESSESAWAQNRRDTVVSTK